jgi:3-dehydroquinate synthetase
MLTHIKKWVGAACYPTDGQAAPLEIHGDEQMVTQSNTHFYVNWAKERLDEMDAILTSLEGKAAVVQADARDKANKALADLGKTRDGFRDTFKKQAEANEATWISAMAKLETEWNSFETELKKYVESFGKQIEHQQATFKLQAAAQLKAWHEAADKLGSDAKKFAAERRTEIDAAVKRMSADAAAAEEKLQKLNQAGTQSWSSLMAALTETRAAFDRANQAVREAFKRAA